MSLSSDLPGVDVDTPNSARMYDFALGGSHNFAADRAAAARAIEAMPSIIDVARGNRAFLGRAVRHCQRLGIDQFLDLGSGIPTVGNVHEIARAGDPGARVAYVDQEPVAVAMSQSLLADDPLSSITQADLRDVDGVLRAPGVRELLDLSRPVALLTVAVMHFVPDSDDPAALLARYRSRLVPGSLHVLSHGTDDFSDEIAGVVATYRSTSDPATMRSRAEVEGMMAGLEILEPGIVEVRDWHPDDSPREWGRNVYGVVGRIPVPA